MDDGERRRRRTRGPKGERAAPVPPDGNEPGGKSAESPAMPPVPGPPAGDPAVDGMPNTFDTQPIHDERDNERGLRGLIGGGSSQVSVSAAMRARDAARPTGADIADAEATLTIVRRGWVPRDNV